ncbi:MAG TPA: pyridoxal-phosphate dependent enzyme [Polyangiaceae bacterium]|nr:pyridoxal-phosphate dependent enzyme [Polyangiaceae bacterium]
MVPELFELWPALRERLPHVALGSFPTPIQALAGVQRALEAESEETPRAPRVPALYVKRDDLSSPVYGGNKVRTLEVLMGVALARGAREIVATGAFGSNHAVATVLHAPRVALVPRVILFPQPHSFAALENARVSATHAAHFLALPHWSLLPYAMWRVGAPERYVMAPGGAVPEGALGYVAAGLELALQVRGGELPLPSRVYVGVGSTCTSAGLLVGFRHAERLGIWKKAPLLVSVRVTPWPVTSRLRILRLATRAAALLNELSVGRAPGLTPQELGPGLSIDGRELGAGYGRPSFAGARATELVTRVSDLRLDTTYTAKSMSGFLRAARAASDGPGPFVYWATKSSAALPDPIDLAKAGLSPGFRRWLAACR